MDGKRRSIAAVWPSLILLLSIWSEMSRAHVALTFPPARQPALDFLDSGRTPPPCGVPKGTKRSYITNNNNNNNQLVLRANDDERKRLSLLFFLLSVNNEIEVGQLN